MASLGDIVNLCDADGAIRRGQLANHADRDESGAFVVNDRFDINVFERVGDENRLHHGASGFVLAKSIEDQHKPGHWWP